ncbi:hypothetical protein B4Q13_21740, partial [Lacticaseibacillus rhamnosus]
TEILAAHENFFRGKDGGARADLTGADLSNDDLSGLNLSGAILRNANLEGAVMRDVLPRRSESGRPSDGRFRARRAAAGSRGRRPARAGSAD